MPSRLPIDRYWGPCLPAFQRHRWLFPGRIGRGLDIAADLEQEIGARTAISWPVEHASWRSEDGGLQIRVLSPPGRLIERLLIGRSEEHTSELQSLMRISYAVFCLKKKKQLQYTDTQ